MKKEAELSPEQKDGLPVFENNGQDYRNEWARLWQGSEEDFPTEASMANHFFNWPHIIEGERREQFDCTKENSFILIPPEVSLKAYRDAKEKGEI